MGLIIGVGNTKPKFPYDYYYGIEWDSNVANSACTRLGRPELHVSLPIQNRMRRCVLRDNGTVAYYLHANDSTKRDNGAAANLDGTDGQVMVEIPAHYRKFEIEGTKFRCFLSGFELPGFHLVPLAYRSAYEAAIDRTTASAPKLASVVNASAAFRGGQNAAEWDGTYRSLLGIPGTNTSLTSFRAYARRRGSAGLNAAGWNCDVYEVQKTCYWLYAVEYANFNSQLAYNAAPTSEGYKQGGLGDGVTIMSDWGGYNGYNPMVPCGATNPLGNKTGTVAYTYKKSDNTNGQTFQVPSYRGLENPFGQVWNWTDGCKCNIQPEAGGGLSEFLVCTDPAKYQDSNYSDYELRGILPRSEGYVRVMIVGEYGENMPAQVGAGSTTYFCDYFYTAPAKNTGQRGVVFGGTAILGPAAGFGLSDAHYAPSDTYPFVGSRLCFIPG